MIRNVWPRLVGTGSALAGLTLAASASAHHGIANFDLNADIEISGVVTDITFVNPHSWVTLDVQGDDGSIATWRCELRGGTVLRRSGWSPEMFAPGTEITITGSPDRREPNTCYLGTAIFADGTRIDRYGQIDKSETVVRAERAPRLPNGDPNIAGDWASEQRVMTDPRGQMGTLVPISTADEYEPGDVPEGGQAFPGARGTAVSLAEDPVDTFWNRRPTALPLTESGAQAIEGFDGSSADNPRLRCEATNILFDWTFEGDVNRIAQTEQKIRLLYGSHGIERVIHLDMTEHPADIETSLAGHSIGRWEDDVLVVDTVGFAPGLLSVDGRLPHSAELHVVERFNVDLDPPAITRSYAAEDPLYFAGEYRGGDRVLVADLPYQGTAPCEDLSHKTSDEDGAPWWEFWK